MTAPLEVTAAGVRSMIPRSTYRLQLSADFSLDRARERLPQIAALGVTHLYLSPLLAAAAGSTHGYDVVDHSRIDEARGGEAALRRLADAAHELGLGLVLDVVPNHMSVAVPHENAAWWDVLRLGRHSPYAAWFDIDWDAGPLLLPALGSDEAVSELTVADGAAGLELRYDDKRFPVAPGTEGGSPQHVHDRQFYRLVGWRHEAADLTYRRFFDVTSLAGIRLEDRAVYDATHALVIALIRDGVIDGLRIDHPDGLADPGGYLAWLAADTGGAWVVVEKILEPGERLPAWPCAGTTGYDAARLVGGVLVDPLAEDAMTAIWRSATGDRTGFAHKVLTAKRAVTSGPLAAEVARLGRLAPDVSAMVLGETLAEFPVYRSYVPDAGVGYLEDAIASTREALRAREDEIAALGVRLRDPADPLAIRFQQTSGMVMAKGVEDTAFYRHHVLIALNEVGGDPARFGVTVEQWHAECAMLQANWPTSMTLLSSHDTKRSEDVRARITLLAQVPDEWAAVLTRLETAAAEYAGSVAPEDRFLLHQTLVGIGVVDPDRVGAYLAKATREAKVHTAWVDGSDSYDADVQALVRGALADPAYRAVLQEFLGRLEPAWRRTMVAQKLLQLTMPGVPDLYQGSERAHLALVDPDNRRPVEWEAPDDEKTAVVRAVLHLRRDSPELFVDYEPVATGSPYAVAFARSAALVVVASRLALGLDRDGWNDAELALSSGPWTDVLTGLPPASTRLADVVGGRAGAVLVRR